MQSDAVHDFPFIFWLWYSRIALTRLSGGFKVWNQNKFINIDG